MLILLSPAKTLDFESSTPPLAPSRPRLEDDAAKLAAAAAKLSAPRLGRIMHISDRLARINIDRFRHFDTAEERPALFAFAGDVYTGLDALSLDGEALGYATAHIRILSGLYGLLRPNDAIRPYRLEMGTRWAPGRAADLHGYWKRRIADVLEQDLAVEGSGTVLNLASQEYFAAIAPYPIPGVRTIAIDFRDTGPAGLRFNSFVAKKARGALARLIAIEGLSDVEGAKQLAPLGHRYVGDGSDESRWLFVRQRD